MAPDPEGLELGFEGEEWFPHLSALIIPVPGKKKSIAVTIGDGTTKNEGKMYLIEGQNFIEYDNLLLLVARIYERFGE